jgi:iron complex outermembrane receptor protein
VGQPAVGLSPPLYPANIPPYRSYLEPNEPKDTVRNSLIAYELRHEFDQNWALTNRFLAARASLTKDDLTANGLDQTTNVLDRTITYQQLVGTNYSANLDLTGKVDTFGVKHDVLIGADYLYSFYRYILSANGSYPINIYTPMYGQVPTFDFYNIISQTWQGTADFQSFGYTARKDLGVYAQDSITPFEGLHLLLGARYDLADIRNGNGSSSSEASNNFDMSQEQHTAFFSPRLGLVYQPVPWLGFFGSYTRSFGQNNVSGNTIFAPEVAVGWEGGVKAQLIDGRLGATLAFFDITKSNLLTPAPTPEDPTARRPLGSVRSQGAEVDILGKLTDEISLIASYSHIDARIVADNRDDGAFIGNSLRVYAPNSGSVWLTYAFPTDSGLDGWTAGGGVYVAGNRWGDDANTFVLPGYTRLDAMAKYQFSAGGAKWSAQINLKNIANTRYIEGTDIYFNNFGPFGLLPGAPRAVTASLRMKF